MTATTVDLSRPYRVGSGPVEFSTCTDLVPLFRPVMDVNNYYRELGVSPAATKVELRQAYQRLNGQDSPRLTYILHQLLNPRTRAEYDARPAGTIFVDQYVMEAFWHEMIRREAGNINPVIEHINSIRPDLGDDSHEVFDKDPPLRETRALSAPVDQFEFSYYLLCLDTGDSQLLLDWQRLLIAAARRKGMNTSISIGLHAANAAQWMCAPVGFRNVLFLHRDHTPTPDDAHHAISTLFAAPAASPSELD